MEKIFISYSHVDIAFVKPLVERLSRHYDVWYDRHLLGGDLWRQEIDNQIAVCDYFIFILTNEAVESPYCQQEFALARRFKKEIVPVLARARTRLTPALEEYHYIDMSRGPDDLYAFDILLVTLDPDYVKKKTQTIKRQKRRKTLSWFFIIFSAIVLFVSVYASGLIWEMLASVPTASATPTDLPALTPFPTNTPSPTSTPAPRFPITIRQPANRNEAFQVAGFWQQVDFVDSVNPGTWNYTVHVRPDNELRATFNWCGSTPDLAIEILSLADISFFIDDIPLTDNDFLVTDTVPYGDMICRYWDVFMSDWQDDQEVVFTIHYVILEDFNDGYADYHTGEYYHHITIIPDDEIETCGNSVISQMSTGMFARVTVAENTNSRLRDAPNGEQVSIAPAGSILDVVQGPVCNNGFMWWQVYYDIHPENDETNLNEYYWVAEGGSFDYLVEPLVMPATAENMVIDAAPSNFTLQTAYQPFEHGHMFWVQSIQQIWVLYSDGTWEIFDDRVPQTIPSEQPPSGLYAPVSGFGITWYYNQHVRNRLGWGTASEIGIDNTLEYLPSEGAIVLRDNSGNLFYLYVNMRWQQR